MPRTSTQHESSQAGFSGDLNEEDRKKLVTDAVFYIVTQEKKRPMFKKPDVFRAIGLTGRSKDLQDAIWIQAYKDVKDVFGYELKEIDNNHPAAGTTTGNPDSGWSMICTRAPYTS